MKKTHIAFQMSAERLAERGRLYFWTFTFAQTLDIKETRKRWNHLLTLMRRTWPEMCGLRVYEMHKSHGLHVHLLTDSYIDVNAARTLAIKAGWGRIHVKPIPRSRAGYMGKYLSKKRPPCFKGWRLWAGFGKDWIWTKVSNLEKNSSFSRVYHHYKEEYEWHGKRGFYKRRDRVIRSLHWQIRAANSLRKLKTPDAVREAILSGGLALIV